MTDIPKFRIIKREDDFYPFYAQRKVLDLFWIDCKYIETSNTDCFDHNFTVVERYVKRKLNKYKNGGDFEVVATYYQEESENA